MDQKFSEFSEFWDFDKTLKNELSSIKDHLCYSDLLVLW